MPRKESRQRLNAEFMRNELGKHLVARQILWGLETILIFLCNYVSLPLLPPPPPYLPPFSVGFWKDLLLRYCFTETVGRTHITNTNKSDCPCNRAF